MLHIGPKIYKGFLFPASLNFSVLSKFSAVCVYIYLTMRKKPLPIILLLVIHTGDY